MTDLLQPQDPPSWRDHLAAWRARCTPLRVAAGVAATALTVVAGWLLLRPVAVPAPLVLPQAGAADDAGLGPPDPRPRTETAVPAPGTVVHVTVHAAGAVVRPGVYALADGARVAEAITAAGGLAIDADMDRLNLAARVADGERIYVPRKGEDTPPAAVSGSGTGTPRSGAPPGPIDLNTATAEQLDTLPGVGPSTSAAIVTYRERNGRFRGVDELLEVPGIGPAKLEAIRPLVRT